MSTAPATAGKSDAPLARRVARAARLNDALDRDLPAAKRAAIEAELDNLVGDLQANAEALKELLAIGE